jgi:putative hydrolase of the HAD superfamily
MPSDTAPLGSGRPDAVETVLLDAGGVLLDLDYSYLKRLIEARRIEVEVEALSRAEVAARSEINRHVAEGGRVSEVWRDYFHLILNQVGVPTELHEAMIDSLWSAHERFGLWTVAIPGGPEAVQAMKDSGLRIGVVSNAEGRVEVDLAAAGYEGMFETVVDSHVVGVEKPDPAIFKLALERMNAEAATAVFVGDVPSVDVVGARAAGLAPVLIDRHDLYTDWDVPRLKSITDVPAWVQGAG